MKNKYMRNNKGAALISIMIAVAFISILTTSLMAITVNNYHMKAVNAKSKNNFYLTEQKLNVFTNEVRNTAAASTDPVNDICKKIGCTSPNFTAPGYTNRYNVDEIAKIVFPDSTPSGGSVVVDNVKYTFSSVNSAPASNISMVSNASVSRLKTVTIEGVKITSEPVGTEGYTDTIITDIKFQVLEALPDNSKGGIGKFSVMLDSPINFTSTGDPIRWNVYGNAFMSSYGATGAKMKDDTTGVIDINGGTKQGNDPALKIDRNSALNFVGDNMIVYGDILIEDQGVFAALNGSLTVYGDIKVEGNGAFVCTGKLYMMDGTNPRTGQPYGIYNNTGKASNVSYGAVNKLTAENVYTFKEALNLHDNDATNDGLISSIIQQATNTNNTAHKYYFYDMMDNEEKTMSTSFNGRTIGCDIYGKNPVNGNFNNQLVFLYKKGDFTTPIEVRQTNVYCTFISKNPVVFSQVHDVNLTNLGDEAFDYLTLQAANSIYTTYDANAHEINCRASGPSYNDDNAHFKIGDFFKSNANSIVQTALGASSGGGSATQTPEATAVGYAEWKKE